MKSADVPRRFASSDALLCKLRRGKNTDVWNSNVLFHFFLAPRVDGEGTPAAEAFMLFIFVFLAGIVMFFGFALWRFVGVTLLLMAGQTVWQSYLGTPASQIAMIVVAQTILLQLGYFLGLLMAYGRERIIGGEGFTALPVGEPLPKVVPLHGGSAEHLDS